MTEDILPTPTPLSEGFWAAARRHELVVQRCNACGELRHYPRLLCPSCWDRGWSWAPVSGRGTVYSFAVAHRAFHPAWADRVPYAVVTVTLEEGVRMVSDLPDDQRDRVRVGAPVVVEFTDVPGTEVTLPRFRLADGADA